MSIRLIGGAVLNYLYNNIITHIPVHFFRLLFLRMINRKIHPSVVILMHCRILNFWNVRIEENVVINQYCLLDCRLHSIHINRDTDIGPYTRIWTLGHNPDSPVHALYGGDVIIGHHVWIASGVTILPNVSIDDGSVIAAGAVIHKSTNANDIIAGNPGKFIRKRKNDLNYKLSYSPILE